MTKIKSNKFIYLFDAKLASCAWPDNVDCASENEPPVVKTIPR